MIETKELYTTDDIEKNKTMAGLAYLLFFLPLIACPDSKYAKFHVNQGLILLLVAIAGNVVLGFIPLLGWMLAPLWGLAVLVLVVLGFLNGFGGKAVELPVIGGFTILR